MLSPTPPRRKLRRPASPRSCRCRRGNCTDRRGKLRRRLLGWRAPRRRPRGWARILSRTSPALRSRPCKKPWTRSRSSRRSTDRSSRLRRWRGSFDASKRLFKKPRRCVSRRFCPRRCSRRPWTTATRSRAGSARIYRTCARRARRVRRLCTGEWPSLTRTSTRWRGPSARPRLFDPWSSRWFPTPSPASRKPVAPCARLCTAAFYSRTRRTCYRTLSNSARVC